MKRILFLFFAFVACMGTKAASVTDAHTLEETITYYSVDASNQPIQLSAKLYFQTTSALSSSLTTIKFVVLNCHPTITHNSGCPTGSSPQLDVIKYMNSEDALVICPDYIGFGQSSSSVHPYMCGTLTARNVLDCYKEAINYAKNTKNASFASNYYTINVGYSQGGATALAFHRYLETQATDTDRKLVNLRGSVCGAGPYNQNTVLETYEKWCNDNKSYTLDYPVYLFYVLNGHYQAFKNTTMRKMELKECFTEEFWTYYTNTFKAKFDAKETNVDDLNTMLKNAGFNTFYSIINKDYATRTSKVYRTIHKTLANSNQLADGWTPTAPIIFYHSDPQYNNNEETDIVVPYACTQEALAKFTNRTKFPYVDAINDYSYKGSGVNAYWHAAVFNERLSTYGDKYGSVDSKIAEGIVMAAGSKDYTFSNLDHRTFGARFYAQFLSLQLRLPLPAATTTGTIPSTITLPTTTSTYTIPAGQAHEGTSVVKSYDNVYTSLPYATQPGKLTFLQFASDVDGFYFGHDAKRYEVTLQYGEAISYRDITDTEEDFKARTVYAVETNEALQSVLSMTAGVQTATSACDFAWQEFNYRKLNTVNGKSYASAYLPFGYEATDGTAIYTISSGASEGYVTANKVDYLPKKTGAILVNDASATLTVLSPDVEGKAVSQDCILRGSYSEALNNNYLLFGKSNKGNIGFWTYSGTSKVKAYSAYLEQSAVSSVKGVSIAFDGEEDAILNLLGNNDASQEAIYSTDGAKRSMMQRGVNIIRMSDGSVKKVIRN